MSDKSQNGWLVATRAQVDDSRVAGVLFPHGVRTGDVAVILHRVAQQYHDTVEPLVEGTCWGWFVKKIEGSSTYSNHASGTALDFNADRHPMGSAASKTMTAAQIAACRRIIAAHTIGSGPVVRWGGDYTGRPDPMHFEIIGTPAQAAELANKIKTGGRTVVNAVFTTVMPLLQEGDDDNFRPGYDIIRRVQRQLKITDDGVWGPQTTAALGASKLTEQLYRDLFGLTHD